MVCDSGKLSEYEDKYRMVVDSIPEEGVEVDKHTILHDNRVNQANFLRYVNDHRCVIEIDGQYVHDKDNDRELNSEFGVIILKQPIWIDGELHQSFIYLRTLIDIEAGKEIPAKSSISAGKSTFSTTASLRAPALMHFGYRTMKGIRMDGS